MTGDKSQELRENLTSADAHLSSLRLNHFKDNVLSNPEVGKYHPQEALLHHSTGASYYIPPDRDNEI